MAFHRFCSFINFDGKLGASHTEYGDRSSYLHRIRGALCDLARDDCQGSLLHVGYEIAFLGGGIKTKLLELNPTVWSGREASVINEGDPNTTIGARLSTRRLVQVDPQSWRVAVHYSARVRLVRRHF